jgi:hypothetical protein
LNREDDRAFGEFLLERASTLESPLGIAATFYAQRVLDLVTQAVSTGDLANTLQGDLELARAEFLDRCVSLFDQHEGNTLPADSAVATLSAPDRLYSRADVLARPSPVPTRPGVYAWYFKEIPPGVPTANSKRRGDKTLLYVGVSPTERRSGIASRQNLRLRLRQHFAGNAYSSTLRFTLGVLLGDRLKLQLERVGTRLTFGPGESVLSEWMAQNAFVCWLETEKPWIVEAELLSKLSLPLNLLANDRHEFHPTLTALRKEAKARANGVERSS